MTDTATQANQTPPLPPGRMGLPGLGETWQFLRDGQFIDKRYRRYGPIFKTHLFGDPTIIVCDSESARFVTQNENRYFQFKFPASTNRLLGPGSLSNQAGREHKKRRQVVGKAFQSRALAGYAETMTTLARRYLQHWERQGELTWYPQLRDYTFDVACKLLVGLEEGSQTELRRLFERWSQGLFSIPVALPGTTFGRAMHCRQRILEQLEAIARQRQQAPDPGQDALGVMLQAQDEDGNRLSVAELKDQLLLLLFAGHETLTSSLTSFCFLVGQHPAVKARLRAELERLSPDEVPRPERLQQLSYLEQVVQEVLRHVPPVAGSFRQVTQSCQWQGYRIPQGWKVLYQIAQIQRDSTHYPSPHHFDPENFNPDREPHPSKTFGYLPFGGGLRECLGKEFARLEIKVLAAELLRHYDWELLPEQDLRWETVPDPRPRDGLRVRLQRLTSQA